MVHRSTIFPAAALSLLFSLPFFIHSFRALPSTSPLHRPSTFFVNAFKRFASVCSDNHFSHAADRLLCVNRFKTRSNFVHRIACAFWKSRQQANDLRLWPFNIFCTTKAALRRSRRALRAIDCQVDKDIHRYRSKRRLAILFTILLR